MLSQNTGGAAGHSHILGILPQLPTTSPFTIQGLSFLDKPICQASVIAGIANNLPMGRGESFILKFARSVREDLAKIQQEGHALLAQGAQAATIQPGAPISNGLGSMGSSTGGMEIA